MAEIDVLKKYIRNKLLELRAGEKKKQLSERLEYFKLKKNVRKMIKESDDTVTYDSTGLNVLADLLETIVPILKSFYKKLGTEADQRKSFRAHTLKGVQNLLAPISMMIKADGGQEVSSETGAIKELVKVKTAGEPVGTPEEPDVIPLKADRKEKNKIAAQKDITNPESSFVTIKGEDETGRNVALQSFKRVEKQIREAYSILANEEDRSIFYDYLITNLKLYFDKFEDELQTTVAEPTSPEYEQEKSKKEQELDDASAGLDLEEPAEAI